MRVAVGALPELSLEDALTMRLAMAEADPSATTALRRWLEQQEHKRD